MCTRCHQCLSSPLLSAAAAMFVVFCPACDYVTSGLINQFNNLTIGLLWSCDQANCVSVIVVVLETLDSALQQEESLSPDAKVQSDRPVFVLRLLLCELTSSLHHQPSSDEAGNRQQEQNSDHEGNQSCKRKRSGADSDSDLDVSRTRHFSVLRIWSSSTSRFWICSSHFSKNILQTH